MFPNKYFGICDKCGKEVAPNQGFTIKLWGRNVPRVKMNDGSGRRRYIGKRNSQGKIVVWRVRCSRCASNKPLDAECVKAGSNS